ncbi:metalloregulator ArsR/SmtB family transcription factor [Ectobacillus sp. SYSU M60031]|uniref:Metalloregulator ArsR/SmtB family transcription factor n=1 Tax=Ectobacillus ponti TaxID=2961894 RepID=A0AA42BNR5_9BACI|nr:metalloregulator ArsR/SmtB family transcription factor [Ectobacillus ponti]MCP8968275.1 metalloregulator ArsR/SmtB family transcription factor [Ectobacillus ponti]
MAISKERFEEVADQLRVLSHPTRLQIMSLLFQNEKMNVSTIHATLDIPQSTASQHISKLKSAGLVQGTRDGLEILYEVNKENVQELKQAIQKAS